MRICQRMIFKNKIKRNICRCNVSDQSGEKEEHEVQKWEEHILYVGIAHHICVQIIGSTVVQITLKKIDGERF